MKKASESKKEVKKEATSSRPRRNRQPKQTTKQVVVISNSDEIDSDYAEFLRTYDPEKEYSDSENYITPLDLPSSAGTSESEVAKKEESETNSDVESK
jgi:flagellar basal body rod protein FlgC